MTVIIERIFRLASGLIFTIILSKTLPVSIYGEYTYYLSIFSILSCVASFGLDDSIKRFYLSPEISNNYLTLAIIIKTTLSAILTIFCVFYISIVDNRSWLIFFPFFIFSGFSSFFLNLSLISNKLREVSLISLVYNILISLLKLFSLFNFGFEVFVYIQSLEWFLISIIFLKKFDVDFYNFNFSKNLLISLLKPSVPLFLSSLAIIGYYKIDQILITHFLGFESNAVYSLSSQFVISAGIIHGILINKSFKNIYSLKDDKLKLSALMRKYYSYSIIGVFFILLVVATVFPILFNYIWGEQYHLVPNLVLFGIVGLFFSGVGLLHTQKLIALELENYRMYRVFAGLICNIILNIIFIPILGIYGAILATVLSQLLSSVILNLFFKRTKDDFYEQIYSIFNFWRL